MLTISSPRYGSTVPTERYEGEFTYIKSGFALRGEYVQLQHQRDSVGSEQVGGSGFPDSSRNRLPRLGTSAQLIC